MQEKPKHVHCDFFQPQILAFDMVCKTRSFSEAGKALGVSQSNISRRVLSLEKKLGISLIDRNVRPLKLTSEGQLLQDLIRKQIDVVDARLLAVMQRGHKKVLLRLGCITSLEHDLDAPLIKELSDCASRIELRHGTSRKLLSEFERNELDAFLSSQPFFDCKDVYRRFLFSEPNVLVVPASASIPEHPTWENLRFCGLPKIGFSTRSSNGEFERLYFQKQAIEFVESIVSDDVDPFFDFVEYGLGWGIVTPIFIPFKTSRYRNLRILPMPEPVARRDVYVLGRNEETYKGIIDKMAQASRRQVEPLYHDCIAKHCPWLEGSLHLSEPT